LLKKYPPNQEYLSLIYAEYYHMMIALDFYSSTSMCDISLSGSMAEKQEEEEASCLAISFGTT
jgi:hypothetical protein